MNWFSCIGLYNNMYRLQQYTDDLFPSRWEIYTGSLFFCINQMCFLCTGTPNHGSKVRWPDIVGKQSIYLIKILLCLSRVLWLSIILLKRARSDKDITIQDYVMPVLFCFKAKEMVSMLNLRGPLIIQFFAKIKMICRNSWVISTLREPFPPCVEHFHLVQALPPCIEHFPLAWTFPPCMGHFYLTWGIFTLHNNFHLTWGICTSRGKIHQ